MDSSPTDRARSRWPEWSALSLYAVLVAIAIPYHEPCADEAQAWQLARSLSLASLFKTYIRYEGSPGFWHFLLWLMIRAHVSYTGLHWICGAIATLAVSLLVFGSPLPRYLRLSFPFTYFLLFQYAVVARSYVLAPLLLFLAALVWKKSPFLLTMALGFMANASLHMAVLSGGLAVVYAIEQIRSENRTRLASRHKLALCALLLLAFYVFAIWTTWPPHDLALSRVRGSSSFFERALGALVLATWDPMFVSVPFWIVIIAWAFSRRKSVWLLPVLFFTLFCGAVEAAFWHAGLLVPYIITVLWIVWPAGGPPWGELDKAGLAVLGVLIVTQASWSGYALYRDHYFPYSPDPAAAEFLKPYVREDAAIAVTYTKNDPHWGGHAYPSVGILPYFDHNIYANTPFFFWWWSDRDPSEARFNALLPSHPRIVIVEFGSTRPIPHPDLNDSVYKILFRDGYMHRATFCGIQPQGFGLGVTVCHVVFEYPG